jgi:hypothetical protein
MRVDIIVDGLANGRMVRILSVLDAYTRECLALEADMSLGSGAYDGSEMDFQRRQELSGAGRLL